MTREQLDRHFVYWLAYALCMAIARPNGWDGVKAALEEAYHCIKGERDG